MHQEARTVARRPGDTTSRGLEQAGFDYLHRGDVGAAEDAFRQALSRREERVSAPPQAPTMTADDDGGQAMALNNIAMVHMKVGRVTDAVAELEEALRIRERANAAAPSSRGALEIESLQRNLATARGLVDRQVALAAGDTAANAARGPSPTGGGRGWGVARASGDMLHKLTGDELQLVARRLGAKADGDAKELQNSIRTAVGMGDVNAAVQREIVRATFDALDGDGDGELTKREVLKGLRSSAKIKKLLELPEKLFPDEGGSRDNKALVDRVFDSIDKDGGGTISYPEFEQYCLGKVARAREVAAPAAAAFSAAGERAAAKREDLLASTLVEAPSVLGNAVLADLALYDDLSRGLETSHRRRMGIQADLTRLADELKLVDGEIAQREEAVAALKKRLAVHRAGHQDVIGQLDARVRALDQGHAKVQQGAQAFAKQLGSGAAVAGSATPPARVASSGLGRR